MERLFKTAEVAAEVGVHPNTVRLYEEWGYLPPIPRSKSNYRLYTRQHIEQMRLARLALQWPYPGGKAVVVDLVKYAANGDYGMAMERAYRFLANVRMERTYAEAAIEFLERWARGQILDVGKSTYLSSETAERLGVSVDQLRNWERNGLVHVPRDPATGYRRYSSREMGRLRVIRMLLEAGYSMMAILRMLVQFDSGEREHLQQVLDTPGPNEDVLNVADQWLSTLQEAENRANAIIRQLSHMIDLAL
ncbi:MAG: MerR family transcriptional regulator [Chloroflexi bacterium]|nr:MerR family transcriptional regulator [Chloroflexota bacterium]